MRVYLVTATSVLSIFGFSTALAQPPIVQTEVVNDVSQPIPVSGQVSASVTGGVTVDDIPDEVTDRLDLILDRLDSLVDPEQTEAFFGTADLNVGSGDITTFELGVTILASNITITAENDKTSIQFCNADTPFCASAQPREFLQGAYNLGAIGQTLPSVTTLNFSNPIRVSKIRAGCFNLVEGCELQFAFAGTLEN